jgi:hypothetical protein
LCVSIRWPDGHVSTYPVVRRAGRMAPKLPLGPRWPSAKRRAGVVRYSWRHNSRAFALVDQVVEAPPLTRPHSNQTTTSFKEDCGHGASDESRFLNRGFRRTVGHGSGNRASGMYDRVPQDRNAHDSRGRTPRGASNRDRDSSARFVATRVVTKRRPSDARYTRSA